MPECGSGGLTENCKQREGEREMNARGLRNDSRERELCEETRRDDLVLLALTGGKDQNTQWVHGEFIVSSETICPPHTQWVHGEFF